MPLPALRLNSRSLNPRPSTRTSGALHLPDGGFGGLSFRGVWMLPWPRNPAETEDPQRETHNTPNPPTYLWLLVVGNGGMVVIVYTLILHSLLTKGKARNLSNLCLYASHSDTFLQVALKELGHLQSSPPKARSISSQL